MGDADQGIHLNLGPLIRVVDPALELAGSLIGREATSGHFLLTDSSVVGYLIVREGVVVSLGIPCEEWGNGMGPVLHWPAIPASNMLKGAQECLNAIFPWRVCSGGAGCPGLVQGVEW